MLTFHKIALKYTNYNDRLMLSNEHYYKMLELFL